MIKLTRLGGDPFLLNAELIEYVESRPDTFVTLTTGSRIVVAESMDEVFSPHGFVSTGQAHSAGRLCLRPVGRRAGRLS